MNHPGVSVIICTYNRDEYILRSMESIANQNADKLLFELVVVNNNSTDKTHEICSGFKEKNQSLNFKYVIETAQGLSHARNRGLRESTGEIIVYIDDDAFAENDFVTNMISFYDAHPGVMASGGKIIPLFEAGKPKWMSFFLMKLVAAVDLGSTAMLFPKTSFPIGANMAFRKKVFEIIGDFNVNLGRVGKNLQGGEEKDIFERLRDAGYQPWYLPDTVVTHVIPANRMKEDFIRRQAHGIGFSERIRVKSDGTLSTIKKYFSELFKWGFSFVLFLFYSLQFQFAKATMLIRFRYWVSRGLFMGREE